MRLTSASRRGAFAPRRFFRCVISSGPTMTEALRALPWDVDRYETIHDARRAAARWVRAFVPIRTVDVDRGTHDGMPYHDVSFKTQRGYVFVNIETLPDACHR